MIYDVIIACERSGKGRDSFLNEGCNAISVDILPSEKSGPHFHGDIFEFLKHNTAKLMIAHPPCRFLSYAGISSWNKPGRKEQRDEAFDFFMQLWNCGIERICIENPQGYPNSRRDLLPKPQRIDPFCFGEPHRKRTYLWLKNLPGLQWFSGDLFGGKTSIEPPGPIYIDNTPRQKKRYFTDANHGSQREISFDSIMTAMARQWAPLVR
jgi:hypothetical protein